MKEEQHQFLRLLGQLPARLTAINERERLRGRRHRNVLPVRKTLLPDEPVCTWASWIERTVKEEAS